MFEGDILAGNPLGELHRVPGYLTVPDTPGLGVQLADGRDGGAVPVVLRFRRRVAHQVVLAGAAGVEGVVEVQVMTHLVRRNLAVGVPGRQQLQCDQGSQQQRRQRCHQLDRCLTGLAQCLTCLPGCPAGLTRTVVRRSFQGRPLSAALLPR